MGGGLLQLVAYGAQDVYLTGNPQITFFKVAYRRHTNFAIEAIEQTFNGTAAFGSRVTCQITRNGDLINRVYLRASFNNTNTTATGATAENNGVALVPYFGLKLLKSIELEIGGQRIDKHYAEWLYIWNELSLPAGKRDGYYLMVGGDKYNHSIYVPAQCSYRVHVPLEFWFCRNVGLALPLIALQYHEVKINIEFESASNLVDKSANYCDKAFFLKSSTGGNVASLPLLNSALTNSTADKISLSEVALFVDYIFLDTDERRRFAQLSHEYLIEQLQFTGSDTISGSTTVKSIRMNFNHPCKELVWVGKFAPSTAANHWYNYTVKKDGTFLAAGDYPNLYSAGLTSITAQLGAVDTNTSNDILNNALTGAADEIPKYITFNVEPGFSANAKNPFDKCLLQLNGNDRFAERNGSYFNLVQPFQHHTNIPANQGINVYSFALKPEEHQPSGTLNMSRIDTAVLAVTNTSAVSGTINVYATNYNVLRILSGMGGLAYSN
jgi:hypothetical protein